MSRKIRIDQNGDLVNPETDKGILCPLGMNNPEEHYCNVNCAAFVKSEWAESNTCICNMMQGNGDIGVIKKENKIEIEGDI